MNWMKAKSYQAALRNIKDAIPTELENSPVTIEELMAWATCWYLVALEARRIAVMLENERKRRLRNYDSPD